MDKIRNKYYLLLLVVGYLFPFTNTETGWEYTQSPLQCFYIFEYINIDGVEATGDGEPGNVYGECVNNPYTCNVVGAFIERDENIHGDLNDDGELSSSVDVCVGWGYAKSEGYSTIPLIGEDATMDATTGYLESGDIPSFKIYDYVNDIILPIEISNIYYSEYLYDVNGDGVWSAEVEAEPFTDLNDNGE